ncbi:MAG TPA: CoA transferase, partial [Acidimicrobiales bacterium]|nr:CoA transferase [Acidimicrobiales bacterium]
ETYLKDGRLAVPAAPLDHEQMGLSPGYRLYGLADGWIALCAQDEDQLSRACSVVGASNPNDIAARLAATRCDDALRDLRAAGVPCEPVRLDQGEAFLDDEQNRVLGLVASYPHAEWGQLEQVGALWSLGDLDVSLDRAPPALGQHTREVLAAVGLDEAAIAELLAGSVAVQSVPEAAAP